MTSNLHLDKSEGTEKVPVFPILSFRDVIVSQEDRYEAREPQNQENTGIFRFLDDQFPRGTFCPAKDGQNYNNRKAVILHWYE